MLLWILFFFIAFGSKVILAFAMIYLILEEERGCPSCDGETVLVRMGLGGRWLSLLTGGRVQKRWCARCRWEGLTRTGTRNRPLGDRVPGPRTRRSTVP
jgi:hypothetical protein